MSASKTKQKRPQLKGWTKEEATHWAPIGGRVKSEKKKRMARINAVTKGTTTTDKWILKVTTPTPLDRLAGITRKDKIALLKKIAPTLATTKVETALLEYGMTLAEMKMELMRLEKLYDEVATTPKEKISAAKSLMWWKMKYADKEWEFVRDVFGVGKPNFTLTHETKKTEITTLSQLMVKILGEVDTSGNSNS